MTDTPAWLAQIFEKHRHVKMDDYDGCCTEYDWSENACDSTPSWEQHRAHVAAVVWAEIEQRICDNYDDGYGMSYLLKGLRDD